MTLKSNSLPIFHRNIWIKTHWPYWFSHFFSKAIERFIIKLTLRFKSNWAELSSKSTKEPSIITTDQIRFLRISRRIERSSYLGRRSGPLRATWERFFIGKLLFNLSLTLIFIRCLWIVFGFFIFKKDHAICLKTTTINILYSSASFILRHTRHINWSHWYSLINSIACQKSINTTNKHTNKYNTDNERDTLFTLN